MSSTFIVNVEVAVVCEGRLLAITRGSGEALGAGWLCFPGGKLDRHSPDPDILEATARHEVFEEVGIRLIDPLVYVESHTFVVGDQPVLDVVMMSQSADDIPFPASEDEVASVEWLTYSEFLANPATQPWTRASLHLVEAKRLELGW